MDLIKSKTYVENFFYKVYKKMYSSKFLVSIKQGFVMIVPIFVIGAIALLIRDFPIDVIRNFIQNGWNGIIYTICQAVYDCTFGIASLHILVAITYNYSKQYGSNKAHLGILACMTALASYFALLGSQINSEENLLRLGLFNVQNVFSSLVVSLVSTKLFYAFYKLINRKKMKYDLASETSFRDVVSTIYPIALTLLVFILISIFIEYVLKFDNFNALIIKIFTLPFEHLGRNIFSGILILLFQCIFWFFGIHGSNTFESVNQQIFTNVNGELITKSFYDTFVLMGGCGSAICLLIALLIFSKQVDNKPVVKRSILPMIFNINEIMIFGLPVVLNPILLLPFIITPLFCLTTSYLATSWGLVNYVTNFSITWTTPALLSGYLATGSISGSLLQLFNIICGVMIYAPFVKLNDTIHSRSLEDTISRMVSLMKEAEENNESINFLDENNPYSRTAISIVNQLKHDIDKKKIQLFYQPLCNKEGKVISCEGLLRWKNGTKNYLYPPLLVSIAMSEGLFDDLTKCVIEKAMIDYQNILDSNTSFSINIHASQLTDHDFINWVIEKHELYHIPKGMLCLEVTEESAFIESDNLINAFKELQSHGISVAIDDFSMGHTSLNYLQNLQFAFVKLDGGLIKQLNNERVKDIVNLIIKLGGNLGFKVVAEFVETAEQRNTLYDMGCNIYQGYLYSKALPSNEYFDYVNKHNKPL